MEERQQPQIRVIDTSLPKQNEQDDVDLENPPVVRQRRINDHDDISELDDATTYTYTTYITKRSYRYRWLTVAIVVITIIIIFLSRGAVVGGGVNAKNQDVDNTIDTAVGSDRGGGGGGSTQVVKVDKSEKSKKSKSGKW
jgi:hypothetical protein